MKLTTGKSDGQPGLFEILLRARMQKNPGIEPVQALAEISRSALCCHSNETRAPIANSPSSAQLEGTSYHYPNFRTSGSVL